MSRWQSLRSRSNPLLLALVTEGFLSRLSFGIISFAVPLLGLRLGMSIAQIGVLASFNLMVAIALKPATGWLADRVGIRRTFTAAIVLRSVVSLLLVFCSVPWQLFAVRGLHGVSIALRDPASNALLADAGGKKAVARAFAWYQTAKTLAGSIGRATAGVLLGITASDYSAVFAVAFVLSLLPLPVALRYVLRAPAAGARTDDTDLQVVHEPAAVAAALADPDPPAAPKVRVLPYATLGFFITGSAYMLTNLFPVLAVEYAGLTEPEAGSIYLLTAIVSLSGPLWGWLADRGSRRVVLSLRSVANVGSSLLYLVVPTYGGLAVGRVMDDTGKAAFRPAWGAVMADVARAHPSRRARIFGVLSAGEDAGEMLGPIAAGLLWTTFGVPAVLLTRAALSVVTEIYTLRFAHVEHDAAATAADVERCVPDLPIRLRLARGLPEHPVGLRPDELVPGCLLTVRIPNGQDQAVRAVVCFTGYQAVRAGPGHLANGSAPLLESCRRIVVLAHSAPCPHGPLEPDNGAGHWQVRHLVILPDPGNPLVGYRVTGAEDRDGLLAAAVDELLRTGRGSVPVPLWWLGARPRVRSVLVRGGVEGPRACP